MVGKMKCRVTFTRYADPTKTASGGLVQGAATETQLWAKVENRSGSLQNNAGRSWGYDYKITVRYLPTFVPRSNDVVTFENGKMEIKEVSFQDEGAKRFVIVRGSRHE